MATQVDLLERVVNGGGVLLRVEARISRGGGTASALLLTFDVGRLFLSVEPGSGELSSAALEKAEDGPEGLVDACEEEPWWRVLGSPLSGVVAEAPGRAAIRLQFRSADQQPKFVTLRARGASLQAVLESP